MKHKATKRILSLLLAMVMLVGLLPSAAIPAFAEESEEQPKVDSEGYILIWSYEQLCSVAKTAMKGERYRLATDIYQTDSTNDLMIWVRNQAYFSLDLNGHVLSRTTRSLDSVMILVRENSTLYIYDSSPDKTGTCIYNISGASGICSVIDNDGGDVIINGGNYIIEGENIPDSAAVLLGYSGSFTVYDGYFDSTKAQDGVAVRLLELSTDPIPNCIVYGGRFYSRDTCIKATCYDNYAKLGVYYPYVFVMGGEFYTRKITGDEYEGNFAYCSNGWGRVIVANGLVPARSLNARDQRYATGTTTTVEKLTGAPGNGWEYATVTPPPRIVSEQMPKEDRWYSLCWRDYLKAAKENESNDFWTKYQAEIEAELAKVDGFAVNIFDTEVVLSIEDKEEIDSVRWYVSASPDSDWTELVDYQNSTGPITQNPPKQGETLYYRAEVTRKDGTEYEDIIYVNCEEPEKGSAYDEYRLSFNVTPEGEGDTIDLARTVKQSDTFEMSWKVPSYLGEGVVCRPEITVTRPKSNIAPKTYSDSKVTINYSEYPNDVIVNCRLYVLLDGSAVYFEKTYNVDVNRVYTATDGCIHCYAAGEDGWDEVVEGGSCSFKIYPKEYYELTDPDKLEVYVNGELVTPDADGVYTVENVTKDLDIYCDGTGFTSYSNLTVTANGMTVKEKIFDGGTYTFKTLAEFGATVPEGSTFTGWKIGNKTYQPGETYTVPGGTEIAVNAAYKGLHTITVENGKAYADEAHTIPISAAAEDQVIYIVADPAPEGKVFSYWKEIEITSPGGDGWFGSYDSAQTTYTVYYSDVVLSPVYETQIDNIVINGMTKPSAGVAIDNSDYSYKWGCSVPANSGYTLGICYWYDITDGEPEFAMSDGDVFQLGHTYRFKAKINLYGDTILAAKEDISVALTGLDAESYTWTISEYSQIYENMVIYFEFTCEREEPDTSVERPEGSGTVGDPFKISTVGELYWFTGFTNNYVAVGEDFAVERNKAHAILMNDIIVNPELLDDYVVNANSSLLADWSPICASKDSPYCGTFDGQGYSISGLYYNTPGYQYDAYGFIAHMGEGGVVKDLTVKDTYFYIKYTSHFTPYVAGIAAYSSNATNKIENCHFDGVAGGDSSNKGCVAGGITAVTGGKIQNCTAKGRVLGYDSYVGYGKAGGIAGHAYSTAAISDCINYAEVLCWDSGSAQGTAGGIVGYLYGTVKDCSNRGVINGYDLGNNNNAGGIVGWASGTAEQKAVISRCFNMAYFSGSGIVDNISKGYVTVKNCYNTGSVTIGIAGITNGAGISITYCHDVGYTGMPIGGYSSADDVEIDHCYYIDRVSYDTDRNPMTDAKLSEEFADGTVLALLDNGHWTQGEDDEYPVLGEIPGVTVSGTATSFGSSTDNVIIQLIADGYSEADYEAMVTGNTVEFTIEGVAAGTYTLKVMKNNHVTRTYTITVAADNVNLDVEINLIGDTTGDGKVNMKDWSRLYDHISETNPLEDYNLLCADVTGDGKVNMKDWSRLYDHISETNPLW